MHTPISYNNLPRHDTTLLDYKRPKSKDKDTGYSPKLGTSQGNTVTKRDFTPCPRRCRSCSLRRNASMEGVLQSHMRILSPKSCVQHPNPCAKTLVHTPSFDYADH